LILTLLLLLGKLAGETTIKGVVEWVELREIALRKQLDWPRRFPSTATYTRALAGCDAEALARLLAQAILKAHTQEKPPQASASQTLTQVAIDGKTLRGTLGHRHAHQPAVHVLSCYEPQTGLVVAHRAVPHTNAMKSARWLSG
jgi:hypothetical protein